MSAFLKHPPHPLASAAWRGRRVGLLGGSFNPAHEGHVHISLLALRDMQLDAIWWLVSPQNPLKPEKGMAPFAQRFQGAMDITEAHPHIFVCDLEQQLGTRYTADTLQALRTRFPSTQFVWMMGADNMLQISRWQHWQDIFKKTDVAVYRRPPYSVGISKGKAATRFARARISVKKAKQLARHTKKFWILFSNKLNAESATAIRNKTKRLFPW